VGDQAQVGQVVNIGRADTVIVHGSSDVKPLSGLSLPVVDRTSLATPGSLLRADAEIVVFHGREDDLNDLAAWRDGPEVFAVHLVTGEGGQGKTRLAAEFLRRSHGQAGWAGVWVRSSGSPYGGVHVVDQELLRRLLRSIEPVLVVTDYAEAIPQFVFELITTLKQRDSEAKARLLLLARTTGPWWENLRDSVQPGRAIVTHAELTPLAMSITERKEAFTHAVKALADGLLTLSQRSGSALPLGIDWIELSESITTPDLRDGRYANALTLEMTALNMLLAAAGGESSTGLDPDEELLWHERTYLDRVATKRRLNKPGVLSGHSDPDCGIQASRRIRDRALGALILLGPCDRRAVRSLAAMACGVTSDDDKAEHVAEWLMAVYPSRPVGNMAVSQPQPDRLAELMLCQVLSQDADLIERIVPLVTGLDSTHRILDMARHMLAVLVRAAGTSAGKDVEPRVVELITSHATPFATATPWVAATVGKDVELLLQAMCTLADHDRKQLNSQATYAGLQLARESALQAPFIAAGIGFLATLYQRLLAASPNVYYYRAGLASSLCSHAVFLAAIRRFDEAVNVSKQAVDIYQELVVSHRKAHLADLVTASANHAVRLAEIGQYNEAVRVSQQAIEVCKKLTRRKLISRKRYRNHLALALNNHVTVLGISRKFHDALQFSLLTVDAYRALAGERGMGYLPQLAQAQMSHATLLYLVGKSALAGQGSGQAIDTWRKLVDFDHLADLRPNAKLSDYLPSLVDSLTTHAAVITENDRPNEALRFSQLALHLSNLLVAQCGEVFLPTRACVLQNHAIVLATTDAALAARFSRQAVEIYTSLLNANRAAYLPRLAQAQANHVTRLCQAGQYDEALLVSRRLPDACQELVDRNRDVYLPDLAQALNNYAALLADAGRFDQAVRACTQAVAAFRELADHRFHLLWEYVQCLVNLGDILIRSKKFRDAIGPLSIALTKSRDLAEFDRTAITDLLCLAEQGESRE
jgi:tetratricopeptide (TPR) repeat protein